MLFWDTRKLGQPYEEMELVPKSFAGAAEGLLGGCALLCTESCHVLFARIRNLQETTHHSVSLSLRPPGRCSLEYSAAGGATKFMVGTEQGLVLSCNRKAKSAADQITGAYVGAPSACIAATRH